MPAMVLVPPAAVNPSPRPTLPAVDTHFHVFAAGSRAPGPVRYVPAYDATLDGWSAAARRHGVEAGVVVQVSFLGTDNRQLLAALAAAPGRLRGVAVLGPQTPDDMLDALDAAGVRGVRWNLVGGDHRVDAAMQRFASRLGERGWHVEVHADGGRLAEVLGRVPHDVQVVVDHAGRPAGTDDPTTWAAIDRHAARLWVKLSGPYRQHDGPVASPDRPATMIELARRWRDAIGPARLLWGSDWPCTNHEAWQADAHRHRWLTEALGETDATGVLRVNPRSLYRF